jgi:nucleoside-diphosphate-sugar epimerase
MILVTGGTGLVGSHLLYSLSREHSEIRAIYRRTSDLNGVKKVFSFYGGDGESFFERIRWVEADLLDLSALEDAFRDVTHVYHCAALVSFITSDYQRMRRVNIEGTTNIVNLCISNRIEKLCYVSSVAAIENRAEGEITDESEHWTNTAGKSGYAITKYGAEMEVWRASQEGIPVVIVNPGVILGSGPWHKGSGTLISRVDGGLPFYTTGVTGFVDVQDVVRIMISLMESDIQNERFILVAENLTYRDVLFKIANSLKKRKPGIKINRWMTEFIWRFELLKSKITLTPPLLTKHTARSSVSNHPFSSKKIIATLGYAFAKMDDCIDRVVKNYKSDLR